MRPGAIALIDCLGFKGIWTKHDPEVVLDKLRRLQQGVMQHQVAGNQVIAESLSDRGLIYCARDEMKVLRAFGKVIVLQNQTQHKGLSNDTDPV